MEEAEEALSTTIDSEFGRTTDPVRMYMREMGSVELLTREGEIEIAKRIEDGLKHMIQAISSCPTTIEEILRWPISSNARRCASTSWSTASWTRTARTSSSEEMTEEEELEELDAEEQEAEDEAVASADLRAAQERLARALQQDPPPVQEDEEGARREGLPLARLQGPAGGDLERAARHPLLRQAGRAPVQRAARAGRARAQPRARDHGAVHAQRQHAARRTSSRSSPATRPTSSGPTRRSPRARSTPRRWIASSPR